MALMAVLHDGKLQGDGREWITVAGWGRKVRRVERGRGEWQAGFREFRMREGN